MYFRRSEKMQGVGLRGRERRPGLSIQSGLAGGFTDEALALPAGPLPRATPHRDAQA